MIGIHDKRLIVANHAHDELTRSLSVYQACNVEANSHVWLCVEKVSQFSKLQSETCGAEPNNEIQNSIAMLKCLANEKDEKQVQYGST